ncbi:hypothetical protein [Escherichia coli]|uniref:hypothetical protein n=1 Tax=Escherichia coli TaxID=562 RepID=UPI000774E6B4|nr:hypothetical protein [Escherichia coli]EEW3262251.1 hypothetical protein [Escherichia coli]EFJ2067187.1 hypothetical protein [Escherichia coli]EFK5480738.1 hypothetical protein [Escherichia coli]KXP43453.1 hypothetical protein AUQ30_20860 [Escherichia coli]MBF2832424.1 hypothetical protein [Escherichia coli]
MYLVKSCDERDNILIRKTIKIGSLTEYRDTEKEEIADKDEGYIFMTFNLSGIDLPAHLFNQMSSSFNSDNKFYTEELIVYPHSKLATDYLFIDKFKATASLSKYNRFVFCISLLEDPLECKSIFKDYNDYWHIKLEDLEKVANEIAQSLILTIGKRIQNGESLFDREVTKDTLHLEWEATQIKYTERNIQIENKEVETNPKQVIDWLSHSYMLKPQKFRHEKEFRFVFDFYQNGRLLIPKINSIIIPADNIIPFVVAK